MMSIFGISFCYTIKNVLAGEETLKTTFLSVQILFSTFESILIPKEFTQILKQMVQQENKGKANPNNPVSNKMQVCEMQFPSDR